MKTTARSHSSSAVKSASLIAGALTLGRRLLFGQLRLRRFDGSIKVTWGETLRMPAAPTTSVKRNSLRKASTSDFSDSLVLMRSELSIALNAKPNNRMVLRHLVFFETALAKKGLKALEDIPVKTLQKAHDQLRLLAGTVASRDLQALAARTSQAIIRRGGDIEGLTLGDQTASSGNVDVREGRLSDFFMLSDEVILDQMPAKS